MDPEVSTPTYLEWSGVAKGIPISVGNAEAMDLALALDPALRWAAVAVVRARAFGLTYPASDLAAMDRLVTKEEIQNVFGGDTLDLRRYVLKRELPLANEGELANMVYMALNRRAQHLRLISNLDAFEKALENDELVGDDQA